MAVTAPEVLRPDSLTITISQIPGVSPTHEIGQGSREVEAQPVLGEDNHPDPLLFPLTVLGYSPAPNLMQPRHCCPLSPKGHS